MYPHKMQSCLFRGSCYAAPHRNLIPVAHPPGFAPLMVPNRERGYPAGLFPVFGRQVKVMPNIRRRPVIESLNPFIDILNLSVASLPPLAESCRNTGMGASRYVGLGLWQR